MFSSSCSFPVNVLGGREKKKRKSRGPAGNSEIREAWLIVPPILIKCLFFVLLNPNYSLCFPLTELKDAFPAEPHIRVYIYFIYKNLKDGHMFAFERRDNV